MRIVEGSSGDVGQRPHRFDAGAHRHQHAADIGVTDDRHLRAATDTDFCTLDTIPGIADGTLIRPFGIAQTFQTDIEAGGIHHDEHVFEAAVLCAD